MQSPRGRLRERLAANAPARRPAIQDREGELRDSEIVRRIREGEREVIEILLRRYNQRLYRIARGVLRDDAESEDVVQETWLRAIAHLDQLADPDRFGGWLCRIAMYESWSRARRGTILRQGRRKYPTAIPSSANERDPELEASDRESLRALEAAIDALPEGYRLVVMLRGVEQLPTAEAAGILGLSPAVVKTRFHRARMRLRMVLARTVSPKEAFPFLGARCERLRRRVRAAMKDWIPPAGVPLRASAPSFGVSGRP